jgi:PAS domain S-box-containing protein
MLPLIVLTVSFTVSIFAWLQLIEQDRAQIGRAIRMQAESISMEAFDHIWSHIHAIERMAKRWEKSKQPLKHWHDDARLYVKHDPAYHAMLWADSTGMVRQQVLRRDSIDEGVQPLSWMQKKIPQTDLSDEPIVSTTFKPSQGNTEKPMLQIAVPISEGGDRGSHIIGIFQASLLLGEFLNTSIEQGYIVDIHNEVTDIFNSSGRVTYKLTDSQLNKWEKKVTVKLTGRTWSTHIYPSSNLLISMQSQLNNLLLVGAFFLSLLLAWTTYLVQSVRRDAEQLASSNMQLHHEIEKRKQARQALVESEEHSMLILDSVAEGVYGLDTGGKVTFINPAAARMLGYPVEELTGQQMHELIHHTRLDGSIYPKEECPMYMAFTDGKTHTVLDEILWRKNGSSFPAEYTSTPIRNNGSLVGAVINFRDITKVEKAKKSLQKEHELNQRLLAAIPSILIGVSREGRIELWSQAAEITFGVDKAKALGLHLSRINIQWRWEDIDRGIAKSRATGSARIDNVIFQRPDGSEGILGLTINSIHKEGIDRGFLLIGSDITERLKLEGQLQLAQKMEAVGELAAGIAHEINTPLQYVGDNIRFLKDSFSNMHELCEHYRKLIHHCEEKAFALEMIEDLKKADAEADIEFIMEEVPSAIEQSLDGVGKASSIVSAMKEFSHPGQEGKVFNDINRILGNASTVARNEWKYIADLKMELDEKLPPVKCLPEINQVFLNMIVNAAHAIDEKLGENSSEKGLITIQTSHTDRFVEIRISDTGIGIPQERISKVFEPFFTTKEVGKGTGQGLTISHRIIVEQHRGSLEVESEAGKGTTFIIRIPVDQQEES